jgi:hypothetical protein
MFKIAMVGIVLAAGILGAAQARATTTLGTVFVFGDRPNPYMGGSGVGGGGTNGYGGSPYPEFGEGGGGEWVVECDYFAGQMAILGCSLNGAAESAPLNFEADSYEAGTALYKSFVWSKNPYVLADASNRFITTLLKYEELLSQGYSIPDIGGELVEGMATACLIQASGPHNAPFFECVDAFDAITSEVSESISPTVKNGAVEKIMAGIGLRPSGTYDVSISIGITSWGSSFNSLNSSLKKHNSYTVRERDCNALRTAKASYGWGV